MRAHACSTAARNSRCFEPNSRITYGWEPSASRATASLLWPAQPVIKSELHATLTDLQWFVNAYTLSFAALLLTASALGDRLGRRRVFLAGITVFTLASAASALATEPWMLTAARALQGAAGAA